MRRLALLALLLASSYAVAAPAPLPKPQRKAERQPVQSAVVVLYLQNIDGFVPLPPLGGFLPPAPPAQAPAQPPNADPKPE